MKAEKRNEARQLRCEQRLSITEIARILGVAKSSVSLWVRDIELSDSKKDILNYQHYAYRAQTRGAHTNFIKFRALRLEYQEQGRRKAREKDPLHIAGCMLYWAEGRKHRNSLALANSDAGLIHFYSRFLRESLAVENHQISISINCYVDSDHSQPDIENYWLAVVQLGYQNLRKTIVNNTPSSSKQLGRKLHYGVCTVMVHSTQLGCVDI